jgi:hypothetical protein
MRHQDNSVSVSDQAPASSARPLQVRGPLFLALVYTRNFGHWCPQILVRVASNQIRECLCDQQIVHVSTPDGEYTTPVAWPGLRLINLVREHSCAVAA